MIGRHKKVIENYFFMTALQVINSLFYIIIYPYLIKNLGAHSYGQYIYGLTVITYFIYLINFGFDLPATKAVAQSADNKDIESLIFSSVLLAKIYLLIISAVILLILLLTIPFLRSQYTLYLILFLQVINFVLFPTWYFQGKQRMKVVTIIQVLFKLISLPFIFIYVRSNEDIIALAIITSLSMLFGGLAAFIIVTCIDKVRIRNVSFNEIKARYREGTPFFLSTLVSTVKEQGVLILVGAFLGMRDVAIYDLANKIVTIPRTIVMSINGALFPKVVTEHNTRTIRKIIIYEFVIGIAVIGLIITFGHWVILLLGGAEMSAAYPLAIILSITVLSWLIVGAIINFLFIPEKKYYLVTINQFVALAAVVVFICAGFYFQINTYILTGSLAFSGIAEIIFCMYQVRKYRLL